MSMEPTKSPRFERNAQMQRSLGSHYGVKLRNVDNVPVGRPKSIELQMVEEREIYATVTLH